MPFEPKDLAQLREALCQSLPEPDIIKMIIEEAGLKAYRIRLPNGDVETQWHNSLLHAESHGTAAVARLLNAAADRAPRLWEDVSPLLMRHGARRPTAQGAPAPQNAEVTLSAEKADAKQAHRKL